MKAATVLFFAFVIVFQGGCAPSYARALYLVNKAESLAIKAHGLRDEPSEAEKRRLLYEKSCDAFLEAYDLDTAAYTFLRIEMAIDACRRVKHVRVDELREFEDVYARDHPVEAEEGEIFVPIE